MLNRHARTRTATPYWSHSQQHSRQTSYVKTAITNRPLFNDFIFPFPLQKYLKTTQQGLFDLWNSEPEENSHEKGESVFPSKERKDSGTSKPVFGFAEKL